MTKLCFPSYFKTNKNFQSLLFVFRQNMTTRYCVSDGIQYPSECSFQGQLLITERCIAKWIKQQEADKKFDRNVPPGHYESIIELNQKRKMVLEKLIQKHGEALGQDGKIIGTVMDIPADQDVYSQAYALHNWYQIPLRPGYAEGISYWDGPDQLGSHCYVKSKCGTHFIQVDNKKLYLYR